MKREKGRKAARKACSDAVLWLLRTHTPAEAVGTLEGLKIGIYMNTMKVHVVVGIYQGIIEDVSVHKYFHHADEKEEKLRRKYGLPEVKEEREEDHQEKEVRRFAVDLEN